ncbi:MAG TPA: hypothetical protein VL691_02895 [Vicinamibacteria bacterium]|nr:hypothetical protein [Vicinamibacteria bacterium]
MDRRTKVGVVTSTVAALAALVGCGGGSPATPTQPTPASLLPAGMVCDPTPPPLLRMQLKIHSDDGGRYVLDSKPVVPNVDHYCDRVGFGKWKFCDTRPEGDPQRTACNDPAQGRASDGVRWGPTWYYGTELCTQSTECALHESNQFMAIAHHNGTFYACAADTVPVDPKGGRGDSIDIDD